MSQVNITLNTNKVDVNTTNNQIVVTNPNNPNTVSVIQPVTQVVEVIAAGPQGLPGPSGSGANINTGSFVTTSSFNSYTGSSISQFAGTASFASTASFAPSYLPLTGGTINGNVTINGTASISYLNVTFESASVIYSSGSNIFGDATNDTQTLIGTVLVSGSQQITGSLTIAGSITSSGNIVPSANNTYQLGTSGLGFANIYGVVGTISSVYTGNINGNNTGGINIKNVNNLIWAKWFDSTGNLVLQSGSATSPTDNGYRLQVQGSGSLSGSLYTDGFVNHTGTISSSIQPANNPSASLMVIGGTTIQSASILNSSAVLINPIMSASANNQVLNGLDINPTFVGGVGAYNNSFVISGGTGYTAGTYTAIALTGGSGTGAQATIIVNASGVVTSVAITTAGTNYNIGDVLSCANTIIGGGSGSGFTYTVTVLANSVTSNALRVKGDYLPLTDSLFNLGSSTKRFQQIFARQNNAQYYYGQSGLESYFGSGGSTAINFVINNTVYGRFAATTGNFILQNGGTFTDDGINRLQVSGSARVTDGLTVSGSLTVTGSITSSGNIVPSANSIYDLGSPTNNFLRVRTQNVVSNLGSLSVFIQHAVGAPEIARFYSNTGNLALQPSGSTFTDDGINRLQVSGSARITNGLTVTGSVNITGSLVMSPSSSFILPLSASAAPAIGSAYWSGSFLFVHNGTRYMSASFF